MKKNQIIMVLAILIATTFSFNTIDSQTQTASEILQKAEDKLRGEESAIAELKMTIQRPTYTREMQMKSWTIGEEYALILISAPARDKGNVTLKRNKEIWNWVPGIEKVIKLPPSMMLQNWMGSDFTNEDFVRSASLLDDYEQRIVKQEEIDGFQCHVIELIPNEETAVVWGKIMIWISIDDYYQLKMEFYDEDDYLVNTMEMSDVKELGGRFIPTIMKVIPEENPENRTIIEYLNMEFNVPLEEQFFTVQNMKRIR